MRIHELVLENQLDELSARGVGTGIGKVAGSAVRGASNFWSGLKQGYQQGRADVDPPDTSGQQTPSGTQQSTQTANTGTTTQQSTSTTPQQPTTAPTQQPTATPTTSGVTVKQINSTIPNLRNRDLQSVKKTVDTTIAKKSGTAQQPTAPAVAPNTQTQQTGKKKTAALLRPPVNPNTSQLAPRNPNLPPLQAVEESIFYSKFLGQSI